MLARNAARAEYYDAYDQSVSTAWERKAPVAEATDPDPRIAWHDAHNAARIALHDAHNASRTDHYDASTAQAIKDAAYADVDADLQNAWRNRRSL
jgi:hypothetical protein